MKKLIIPFLLALFTGTHSYAQDTTLYRSYFGEEFTKWYVYTEGIDYISNGIIGIKTDSLILINGKKYKGARVYGDEDMPDISGNTTYNYLLREVRESGRLYCIYNDPGNNEFLVSDMSLQLGDTFRLAGGDFSYINDYEGVFHDNMGYYTLVDSVYYKEGRKHIRTVLIENVFYNIPFTLIEGLGPNYSIDFIFEMDFYWHHYLICYHTESEFWKSEEFWKFPPATSKDCLTDYSSIEEISLPPPFKVIANPGSVGITFETGINGRVALYDMQARQLQQKETNRELSISIPTGNLTAGIYLVWVFDREANRTWTEKIIIK